MVKIQSWEVSDASWAVEGLAEGAFFGSLSAIYTHFMRWMKAGFFVALWRPDLPSTKKWRASPGVGRASTGP